MALGSQFDKCGRCGDVNPTTEIICSGCGSRLPWADDLENQRRQQLAAQATAIKDKQDADAAAIQAQRALSQQQAHQRHVQSQLAGGSICNDCGNVGAPMSYNESSCLLGCILGMFGIVPGLLYLIWANNAAYRGCRRCKSRNIVTIQSPQGQSLLQHYYPNGFHGNVAVRNSPSYGSSVQHSQPATLMPISPIGATYNAPTVPTQQHRDSLQDTLRRILPRRSSSIAWVGFCCGLAVISLSLLLGVGNVSFGAAALLDGLFGASLWTQAPPMMWAFWGLVFGGMLAFWLDAPLYGLRHQRRLLLAVPVVFLLMSALVIGLNRPEVPIIPDPTAPPPAPPPVPPAPNFGGKWDTGQWGSMSLTQDGAHVYGTYTYANGLIEGQASPSEGSPARLTFRWRNRDSSANGVGYFDLASDAQSFSGGWSEGETLSGNGQDWSGKRTASPPLPPPPPTFSGTWNTEWGEMQLHAGVSTVTGTYEYGRGTIEGDLSGKVLQFRWLNRVTGQKGLGALTLADDGNSIIGTWKDSGGTDEPWAGQRVGDPPKPTAG